MNEAEPPFKLPPRVIIGGVIAIVIVIVLVVLWQMGVFDSASSTPAPGPAPALGPAPLSQNSKNLKTMIDAQVPNCEANLDVSIWSDSVGIYAVPIAQDCPSGTKLGVNPDGTSVQSAGFKSCAPKDDDVKFPFKLFKRVMACTQTASPPTVTTSAPVSNGNISPAPNRVVTPTPGTHWYAPPISTSSPSPYTSPAPSPV